MIDNVKCTLGKNNFLDVKFFVRHKEDCQAYCGKWHRLFLVVIACQVGEIVTFVLSYDAAETPSCRYYWWHPIEDSDTPLYCYMFRQCAAGDKEPEVCTFYMMDSC